MQIVLEIATVDKRQLLENLLQLYAYDFSEFTNDEIGELGNYDFGRLLRYYWNGQSPDPYVIKVEGNIAGFVMVKKKEFNGIDYESIAEFFILKKYRKSGIGKEVAQMVFRKFSGNWYVDVIQSNHPACSFWEKVIDDFCEGKYTKSKDKGHKKTIFTFVN